MGYDDSRYNQLGEEILFNLQPTVSDAAGLSQMPLSLQQQADVPVQNNTNSNNVLVAVSVLVALYLYSRF
jgi:hypothetical protein